MAFSLIDDNAGAVPLVAVSKAGLTAWRETAAARERDWVAATGFAGAVFLARDLINTPASDLGPAELADAAVSVAEKAGARYRVILGDALLAENYPTIHAVGRASTRAPRLVDIVWGDEAAPKVTLVGKGVCFDSGGLDLKTAAGMRMMKKDMAGAAIVLGLAQAIMDAEPPRPPRRRRSHRIARPLRPYRPTVCLVRRP